MERAGAGPGEPRAGLDADPRELTGSAAPADGPDSRPADRLVDGRLLLVVDTPDGGLGAVAERHRRHFAGRGWTVTVAGPAAGPDSKVVPDRIVPIPGSVRRVGGVLGSARALRRVVRAERARATDAGTGLVVHAHGPRALLVTLLAGVHRPFVTIHGSGAVPSDPRGYHRLRTLGLGLLPKLTATAYTAAPELDPPWTFVPHASPQLADLERRPVPRDVTPTFLWLARVDEGRSADVFVRALARVAAAHPVRGVVAGTGPGLAALEAEAARVGAPVDFVGQAAPRPLLEACTALVLLSSHEAVNFAVQEAMWTGRAVVTTRLPGLEWLAGPTGSFVADEDETTAALRRLCDPDVAAEAGARAADRIRAVLAPDEPWITIERAYRSAAGGPPPAGTVAAP